MTTSVATAAPTIPYGGIKHEAQADVDDSRDARHDPVSLRPLASVPEPIEMTLNAGVGDRAEREQAARRRRLAVELGSLVSSRTSHGASSVRPRADPARREDDVREDVRVRRCAPPRSSSIEYANAGQARRNGELQEQHRRGDADGDGVHADLGLVLEDGDEPPVGEADRPQRERGRDERSAEPVHCTQQRPVELEAEVGAPQDEQHGVHHQRAGEDADEGAERPLVEHDDEQHRGGDRHEHVREASRSTKAGPSAPRRAGRPSAACS